MFLIMLACVFLSCETNEPEINKPLTGEIRFNNNSKNPYKLYINNVYETTMLGNSFVDYTLEIGYYKWRAEQQSGYLFYPAIFTSSNPNGVYVGSATKANVVFP